MVQLREWFNRYAAWGFRFQLKYSFIKTSAAQMTHQYLDCFMNQLMNDISNQLWLRHNHATAFLSVSSVIELNQSINSKHIHPSTNKYIHPPISSPPSSCPGSGAALGRDLERTIYIYIYISWLIDRPIDWFGPFHPSIVLGRWTYVAPKRNTHFTHLLGSFP